MTHRPVNLTAITNPAADADGPLAVPAGDAVVIVPRHLSEESAEFADTYLLAAQLRANAPAGERDALEATELATFEDFASAVSPRFTNRRDALAFIAQLQRVVDLTWPVGDDAGYRSAVNAQAAQQ